MGASSEKQGEQCRAAGTNASAAQAVLGLGESVKKKDSGQCRCGWTVEIGRPRDASCHAADHQEERDKGHGATAYEWAWPPSKRADTKKRERGRERERERQTDRKKKHTKRHIK